MREIQQANILGRIEIIEEGREGRVPQSVCPSNQYWSISIADPMISKVEVVEFHSLTSGLNTLPSTENPGGICFTLQQGGGGGITVAAHNDCDD